MYEIFIYGFTDLRIFIYGFTDFTDFYLRIYGFNGFYGFTDFTDYNAVVIIR
ncbi:MAG: hypothetical protein U5L45_20030 [Saprospiraceae bacterium]|nr:hypothetical protein [Saprospiraceae bacterium]